MYARTLRPIVIIGSSDSANAFASVANLHPRSVDKLNKIILSPLMDLATRVFFCFVDGQFNLAEAGAKTGGNVWIFAQS